MKKGKTARPTVILPQEDGDIFSVMEAGRAAMKGFAKKHLDFDHIGQTKDFEEKIFGASSYNEVLVIAMSYFLVGTTEKQV